MPPLARAHMRACAVHACVFVWPRWACLGQYVHLAADGLDADHKLVGGVHAGAEEVDQRGDVPGTKMFAVHGLVVVRGRGSGRG